MPETIPKGPLFILFTAVFLGMLGLGVIIPILPVFVQDTEAAGFWIGALFASYGLARILFTARIGDYSDRHGRKTVIAAGLALYAVISLAYLIPTTVWGLFVIRFLHGIASAMIGPVARAYVADITPPGKEGLFQGRLSIAFYLGFGSGPVLGGMLYHLGGMEAAFLPMALISLILCLLCIRFLPESVSGTPGTPSILRALASPQMQALLFYRFCSSFPTAAFILYLPLLAAADYQVSSTMIGAILAMEIFTMGLTQGLFGRISDRRRTKFEQVVAGTLISSFAVIAMPLARDLPLIALLALLVGLGAAIGQSAALAKAAILGREYMQGVAMGSFNTVVSLSITIPPFLLGILTVRIGINDLFFISGAIALAALLPFWLMVRRIRHDRAMAAAGDGRCCHDSVEQQDAGSRRRCD